MKNIVHTLRAGWVRTATIANGAQLSSAIENKYGGQTLAVSVPAAFTGTSLTFEVSADGTTYQGLYYNSGAAATVVVAQGRSSPLPNELIVWPYFKVKSGSAEGGARTLTFVTKG